MMDNPDQGCRPGAPRPGRASTGAEHCVGGPRPPAGPMAASAPRPRSCGQSPWPLRRLHFGLIRAAVLSTKRDRGVRPQGV